MLRVGKNMKVSKNSWFVVIGLILMLTIGSIPSFGAERHIRGCEGGEETLRDIKHGRDIGRDIGRESKTESSLEKTHLRSHGDENRPHLEKNVSTRRGYNELSQGFHTYTPHDPIKIDNDTDFAEQASENDWSGNGTEGNPFIIEGYEIDGGGHGYGIYVGNTTVHFEIRDNHVYNTSGASGWPFLRKPGFHFYYVKNGTVLNNTAVSNERSGISITESHNLSIVDNIIINHEDFPGIELFESTNITLVGNVISKNREGIFFRSGGNNDIYNNTITDNKRYGIRLQSRSTHRLFNNTLKGNGIYILGTYDIDSWVSYTISPCNTVNGNPVYYWKNRKGGGVPSDAGQVILVNSTDVRIEKQIISNTSVGIQLGFSNGNTLANNSVLNSSKSGLSFYRSHNNTIIDNTFSHNKMHNIYFTSSVNNTLRNNNVSFSDNYGIDFGASSSNTLTQNSIFANGRGIFIGGSPDNIFRSNIISNNERGFELMHTFNNTFINNTVSNSGKVGVDFVISNHEHLFIDNSLSNNTIGMDGSIQNSNFDSNFFSNNQGAVRISNRNNVLENNIFADNVKGIHSKYDNEYSIRNNTFMNNEIGILLEYTQDHTLNYNTFSNNEYGMYINNASASVIYHNIFLDNHIHAYADYGYNRWNKPYPLGGNYWDDHTEPDEYSGPDRDKMGSDGMVDEPRYILGSGGYNVDEYPWTNPTFSSSPFISNLEPPDEQNEVPVNTTLSVEIESDDYPVEVEFYLDDTLKYSETLDSAGRVETDRLDLEYGTTHEWYVEAFSLEKGNRTISPTYSFETEPAVEFNLTVNIEGEGTVEVDGEKVEDGWTNQFNEGEDVGLVVFPEEGWYFDEWIGDYEGREDEITITMDDDKKVTAHFREVEEDERLLTIYVDGEGTTDPEPGTHAYIEGTEVILTAMPDEGHEFVEWTGDYEGTEDEITIVMDDDKEVTAVFEEIQTYELTVGIEGEGVVEVEPEREEYEAGIEVTLTAVPDEGWYFVEWTSDAEGTEEDITIIMDDDKEVTAHFAMREYTLTVHVEGEGLVEIDPEQEQYEHGTEVNLTAIPEDSWYFAEWTGDVEGTEEEITVVMHDDKEITAVFEEIKTYELTVDVDGKGEVVVEPEREEYEEDTEVTLTAVPDEGWYFEEWTGDETSTEVEITVIMDEDKNITAHFEKLSPAEFEFSALTVEPKEPEVGEEIKISVDVTNVGEIEGEYTVQFYINGDVIGNDTVTVEAGETETISTSYEIGEDGEYHIEAEDASITFTVEEEEEVPTDGWLVVALILSIIALLVFVWMGMQSDEKTVDDPEEEEEDDEEEGYDESG